MKTFEEALKAEVIRKASILESEGSSTDSQALIVFEYGANWAAQSPELINEILTKYHEWASNIPSMRLAKWGNEEGDFEKTKARIRKEFIEFLNENQ